jgi:speckle-type POZ protein
MSTLAGWNWIVRRNEELTLHLSLKLRGEIPAFFSSDGKSNTRQCGARSIGSDLLELAASNKFPCDFSFIVCESEEPQQAAVKGRQSGQHGSSIPAHKLILAARSPVLRAMITSGMKESCADEMEITGYAVEAVRAFVRFLYCDSCTEAALEEHGWELLGMADQYDVPALREVCESYIVANMSTDTALVTLQRADLLNSTGLKKRAMEFIVKNAKTLIGAEPTHILDELSSEVLRELLIAMADAM